MALKCSLYRHIRPKVYTTSVHGPLGLGSWGAFEHLRSSRMLRRQPSQSQQGCIIALLPEALNPRVTFRTPFRVPLSCRRRPIVSIVVPVWGLTIFICGILQGNPQKGTTMETLGKPWHPQSRETSRHWTPPAGNEILWWSDKRKHCIAAPVHTLQTHTSSRNVKFMASRLTGLPGACLSFKKVLVLGALLWRLNKSRSKGEEDARWHSVLQKIGHRP